MCLNLSVLPEIVLNAAFVFGITAEPPSVATLTLPFASSVNMDDLPSPSQKSPHTPSPDLSVKKPVYLWPANEYQGPENPHLYGNGTYDGLEVVPGNDKEYVATTAHHVGNGEGLGEEERRKERRIWGLPMLAFYALLALIALLAIIGAVLGGILGSKAANKSPVAAPAATPTSTSDTAPNLATSEAISTTASSTSSASAAAYSGPLRSDEWHFVHWPKESLDIALTATDPWQNTDGTVVIDLANKTAFSHILETLHNETWLPGDEGLEPSHKTYPQQWQFLEVPTSIKSTEALRIQLGENGTLYWISNRELGQNYRLSTDSSTSQDPKYLPKFDEDGPPGNYTSEHPIFIRLANDLNPAQWWYIGNTLNGIPPPPEDADGWWIANAYTRSSKTDGSFWNLYMTHTTKNFNTWNDTLGTEAIMSEFLPVAWHLDPVQKIKEDGWTVV